MKDHTSKQIIIDTQKIKTVSSVKLLGVEIDEKL